MILNSKNFKKWPSGFAGKRHFFNFLNHSIGQYLKVVQIRFYPFMSNICSNLKFWSYFLTKILSIGNWFKQFLNFDWSKCKPWWQCNWMGKSILEILFFMLLCCDVRKDFSFWLSIKSSTSFWHSQKICLITPRLLISVMFLDSNS